MALRRAFAARPIACAWAQVELGGWAGAKAAGELRAEGKDYVIEDGDVCVFLHSAK
eukprot:SAG11_NODE_16974_length_532_cov_1.064665_1_plen_56_part_00